MIPVAVVVGADALIGPAGDQQSPAKGSPYERGRFATLPGEAIRCGGLRADRVVRPYTDFYKIHSMHTRPGRCK